MKGRTKLAVSFTALYLVGVILVVVFKDAKLFGLELNELGDFVAGAFGPLALAWLIFGYFQQGDELQQGTEALRIQSDELKNSVEQQRQLAAISLQALELEREQRLEHEKRRRHSLRPIFHINDALLRNEDGNYAAACRLYNDGAQVYSVSIQFEKGGGRYFCASSRTLVQGGFADFRIAWPIKSAGDFTIVIHYTDADSMQSSSKFVSDFNNQPGHVSFFCNDDDLV
ncbi:hypothetical protein C1X72_07485 [Pseudomonas sp. FW306-2-2C-D06B]|uniref:hypothetical protein n=1 Tax=unclassified Pseudomonas TaxID=196821 RepID=UPI000C88F077|nr:MULTISPECIES: hypothetical protein [unclassified Pseudomonas]PMY81831.1 hypothetical protein C1X72_07485 [Pseudomonas sp. FW306-2-2C-D06B]